MKNCRSKTKQPKDASQTNMFTHSAPVAQWLSIALAAQRLWVQFPGNTHTEKKKNMYNLNAL